MVRFLHQLVKKAKLLSPATLIIVCLLTLSQNSIAQRGIEVPVKLDVEKGDLDGITIKVKKDGKDAFTQSGSNKSRFKLEFNKTYTLVFTKEGYITKTIEFDTHVSADRAKAGFEPYTIGVKLFRQESEKHAVVYNQPVGRVHFDKVLDEFNYQTDYSKSILSGMEDDQTDEKKDSTAAAKSEALADNDDEDDKSTIKEEQRSKKKRTKDDDKTTHKSRKKKPGEEDPGNGPAVAEDKRPSKDPARGKEMPPKGNPNKGGEQPPNGQANKGGEQPPNGMANSGNDNNNLIASSGGNDDGSGILNNSGAEMNKAPSGNGGSEASGRAMPTGNGNDSGSEQQYDESENITREDIVESNRVITIVKVTKRKTTVEYRRVTYRWGGPFYFKDNQQSISQNVFAHNTGVND